MEHAAEWPVLAIDLGGTRIRAALVLPDREVACGVAVETRDDDGPDAAPDRIADAAAAVPAAGVSAPGPLDPWRGIILTPPNLALIGPLPIVHDRIGDPSFAGGSSAAPLVTAQQGAPSS